MGMPRSFYSRAIGEEALMPRVVDTVIPIAFRDKNDPYDRKANKYMAEITLKGDILVPSVTLMEFDLELKAHGYSDES
ncbi:MAG: hypothetical protein ABSF83_10530, partial [Nitrososphaerales archaeon]